MDQILLMQINEVDKTGRASKLARLLKHPLKYITALGFNRLIYPIRGKKLIVPAKLFYGASMKVALPASTDIYLTGGKSHPSEIRLARFLIRNLRPGDQFLDIGAHYGYFTLLAGRLTGPSGRVISFEPASESFELLQANTARTTAITTFNKAVSDIDGTLTFYEFPNQYSEYNALDVAQFEQEEWFQKAQPRKTEVPSTTIDKITQGDFKPKIIKIDVEGGELGVIKGGLNHLGRFAPAIAMEYLEPKRNNAPHRAAAALLTGMGYAAHLLTDEGALSAEPDIEAYLATQGLESDNVIFVKA